LQTSNEDSDLLVDDPSVDKKGQDLPVADAVFNIIPLICEGEKSALEEFLGLARLGSS